MLPKASQGFRSESASSKWKWPETDDADAADDDADDLSEEDDIFYDSEAIVEPPLPTPQQQQPQQQLPQQAPQIQDEE